MSSADYAHIPANEADENLLHRVWLDRIPLWLGSPVAACNSLAKWMEGSEPILLNFINANVLVQALRIGWLKEYLRTTVNFNDGIGIKLALRLRGLSVKYNLNGSDFIPVLLSMANKKGWSVYILGSTPRGLRLALAKMSREFPNVRLGSHHGYFQSQERAALVEEIKQFRPDVLLVSLGVPLQEKWLSEYACLVRCKLACGVGAFVDYYGGAKRRAPKWVRRLNLEWVWRLLWEPRRLFRRYVVDGWTFVKWMVKI